ncbi:hypothetical protein GPECTOR_26g608 [Gonium pectorale]|uniref:DEP domain-containing protein n=1 Tax=Gonium pectorale TaxID=33097 RepID=A0A150GGG8_GONPE|nr:hypothetical protein GPECTOR_26g608 [Gonium pectorale]|eukprot:KXZ48705.1 hypothetical protein GPECTOR_26g608 [Gonium pectorale]
MDGPEGLRRLAAALRAGLDIRDRRYLLRTYRRCFVGRDAVAWMLAAGAAAGPAQAVALGDAMLRAGLLHHVLYEHGFEDALLFYRFAEDDPPDAGGAGAAATPRAAGIIPNAPGGSDRLRRSLSEGAARGGVAAGAGAGRACAGSGGADGGSGLGGGSGGGAPRRQGSCLPTDLGAPDAQHVHLPGHATAVAGTSRRLSLLPEPRLDKSRRLLAGQLAHLQGEVMVLQRAAEQQQSTTGSLVSELAALRGGLAALRGARSRHAAGAQSPLEGGPAGSAPSAISSAENQPRATGAEGHAGMLISADPTLGSGAVAAPEQVARESPAGISADVAELRRQLDGTTAQLWAAAAAAARAERRAAVAVGITGAAVALSALLGLWPRPWVPPLQQALDGAAGPPAAAAMVALEPFSSILVALCTAVLTAAVLTGAARRCQPLSGPWPVASASTAVVPTASDFVGWPDAPVLLALHTGTLLPEPHEGDSHSGGTRISGNGSGGGCGRSASGQREAADGPAPPWPAAPLISRPGGLVRLAANGAQRIRLESELFSGELLVFVRGLPNTPVHLFAGKKRASWVAMQGRFKAPLSLDSVVTGQEFSRPFRRLPAAWFVEHVLIGLARQVSPSMRVGPLSSPSLLMPLIASAQLVNVSEPGTQPPAMACPEDVRLFCPQLTARRATAGGGGDASGAASASQPASSEARRRYFTSPRNRAGLVYDTRRVWTFHFWQQFVDLSTYKLDFSGLSYDLVRHLDGQPLQIMAKDESSGRYLYNVSVWHERLLPSARS